MLGQEIFKPSMKVDISIGSLLLWSVSLNFIQSAACLDTSTLRLVQVVYRHGDRTADKSYPTGLHSEDFWPQGFNQITTLGMQQAHDLGRYLRSRYDGYLNSTYVRYEVYARSARKDRTLMSSSCLLAGLYPPKGQQIWNPELYWQPIPVHTNDYDPMLDHYLPCERYSEKYNELVNGPKGQDVYQRNKDFIETVITKTGFGEPSLQKIWKLYDPLFVEALNDIQPDWFTDDMLYQLQHLRNIRLLFEYKDKEMNYLRNGLFMHQISNNTKTKADDTMDQRMKLFLYSVHDTSIAAVMMALNVWDYSTPPYASALIFELHQKPDQTQVVKVLYKNDTISNLWGDPHELKIPGCAVECPVSKFLELVEPAVMRGNWEEECGNIPGWLSSSTSIAVVVTGSVLVLILLSIIAWCGCNKYKHRHYETL